MAKTSLIISSTSVSDGKKLQKTLTDINSAATNDQLKSFAQVLNNLTTNTYLETNRVDRSNCDTEDDGGTGATRELTVTGAAQGATATVTYTVGESESSPPSPACFYLKGTSGNYTVTYLAATVTTAGTATCTIPNETGYLYTGITAKNGYGADFIITTVS